MSKFLMIITADTNDADYVKSENWVTEEDISEIKKVWEVVKDSVKVRGRGDYNWWTVASSRQKGPYERYKDILTTEQLDIFNEYVPHPEGGIHTVESIVIHEVIKTTKL